MDVGEPRAAKDSEGLLAAVIRRQVQGNSKVLRLMGIVEVVDSSGLKADLMQCQGQRGATGTKLNGHPQATALRGDRGGICSLFNSLGNGQLVAKVSVGCRRQGTP